MKKLFSILCLSFFLVACNNEETKDTSKDTSEESVQQEVEEKDYYTLKDDLPMVASILGEHEIVALGESIHGSLDLNQYKTDLIKELIDKHNFNKIYIESSKAETDYFNESNDENIIPEDILPIELLGTSFESLFELDNVKIVGIDYGPYVTPTLTGNYVLDLITEDVSKIDENLSNKLKSFETNLMRWEINELDDEGPLKVKNNIYEEIMNHKSFNDLAKETQNFIETRNKELNEYYTKTSMYTDTRNAYELRDQYMAENIKADMDDGDKGIVLAHNGHVMLDMENYESQDDVMKGFFNPPYKTISNHLIDDGFDLYVVGMFVNEGKFYPYGKRYDEVTLDHKDEGKTFEGFLSKKVDVPVFIDYKTGEFVPDTVTGAYDHGIVKYKADMKKNQDGIIYIPKIEE